MSKLRLEETEEERVAWHERNLLNAGLNIAMRCSQYTLGTLPRGLKNLLPYLESYAQYVLGEKLKIQNQK
ncbi:MAG: hypothetical protein AABY03_02485 [Nanoarchaeota archaeon]